MVKNKIIYYYQTFVDMTPIIESKYVTNIHISSTHFGYETENNKPYIHINDVTPDNKVLDKMWNQAEECSKTKKIILMIGGAGGAFQVLFNNFETFYPKLYYTLKQRPFISGVDLDVEENVNIEDIKMLINKIKKDFGNDFIISMAPVQYAMENNSPGLGGFSYQELYNSKEGKLIDYFNVQAYSDYSFNSYEKIINNGYPPNKIVFGMLSSEFNKDTFTNALETIKDIKNKYNDFGGVFNWEYFNSPPNPSNPIIWSNEIGEVLVDNYYFFKWLGF